ncbi:cupin domain-containing protein [soil metagenome]
MQTLNIDPADFFEVLTGTNRSQAATIALAPGQSTGGPDNRHARSDQWLYVLAGVGTGVVAGCEVELRPGTLLLIEAGDAHELTNTGTDALKTLNLYAPPAY